MSLSTAEIATLSRLLDQGLDLPLAEREVWLAALPAQHAALLPHLRQMLAADAGASLDLSSLPRLDGSALARRV